MWRWLDGLRALCGAVCIVMGAGAAFGGIWFAFPAPTAAGENAPVAQTKAEASPDFGIGIPGRESTASVVGNLSRITTVEADTLLDVAYENDLGFIELVAANPGVDAWLPGEGTAVLLPKQHILPDAPREGIVINLPEMRLYHYPEDGGPVRSYPVGIGRGGKSTPTGATKVMSRIEDPAWWPTAETRKDNPDLPEVVEPGPDNPLGHHALDLDWNGYLIHGTNNKWGIGRRVSRGCIRLYPDHIARLFDEVAAGTPVRVVDQPIKFTRVAGSLYVEAHTTQEQAEALESTGHFKPDPDFDRAALIAKLQDGDQAVTIDRDKLAQVIAERRGIPIRVGRVGESEAKARYHTSP